MIWRACKCETPQQVLDSKDRPGQARLWYAHTSTYIHATVSMAGVCVCTLLFWGATFRCKHTALRCIALLLLLTKSNSLISTATGSEGDMHRQSPTATTTRKHVHACMLCQQHIRSNTPTTTRPRVVSSSAPNHSTTASRHVRQQRQPQSLYQMLHTPNTMHSTKSLCTATTPSKHTNKHL